VLRADVAADMSLMLSRVPEQGTGRRAALPGIQSAGKTGTTNDYRDAWYVGFTGRLVAGAWFGNDDFSPTRQLTGGTLPAMLWRDVMSFAHRGLEPKRLAGVPERAAASGLVATRGGFGIVSQGSGGFATLGDASAALAGRGFREVTAAGPGR
jgi:penicillin-binding protein 1A